MLISTIDSTNNQTVRIDATSTNSSSVTPVLAIGDVLKFTVKSNPENGQGSIAFRGNVIVATLPQNLEVGSSVVAKVLQSNNQLIFQIIDQELQGLISNQNVLGNQLQDIIKSAGLAGILSSAPLELPKISDSSNTSAQNEVLQLINELYANLSSSEQLTDSSNTLHQLVASANGQNSDLLKDISQKLKQLISSELSTDQLQIATLSDAFADLVAGFNNEEIISSKQIQFLLSSIKDHLGKNEKGSPESELLKSVFQSLSKFQESQDASSLKEIQLSYNQINNYLLANNILSPKTSANIEDLVNRLDQIVNVQDQLHKLNPIMQFAGEPALLLFPFIAQGLLTQSEIRLEAEYKPKRENDDSDEDDIGEKNKNNNLLYRRIQVAVPLPSMGLVDVDIAYKENEILVKFTVENEDAALFLKSEVEHLVKILRDNNFEKAEISTQLGKPTQDIIPDWLKSQNLISEKA